MVPACARSAFYLGRLAEPPIASSRRVLRWSFGRSLEKWGALVSWEEYMAPMFRRFAAFVLGAGLLFAAVSPASAITGGQEDTANKYSNVGMLVFYQPDG